MLATTDSVELARRIRVHVLRMTNRARASHVGTCLSAADILAVLYAKVLRVRADQPDWADRDRFVQSKGHGGAALYAVLAERGFFPRDWLGKYCEDNSPLAGHVSHRGVPGVEASTGSLGHGLSLACGMALGARSAGRGARAVALLSDGEMDEGSTWEAFLLAGHHRIENLFAVIDYNKIQSFGRTDDVLSLEPLAGKLSAFGWNVTEVNGHDHQALAGAFEPRNGRPTVVIAHTVKGKGVSFMEDRLEWHYKSPSADELERGLRELGEPL